MTTFAPCFKGFTKNGVLSLSVSLGLLVTLLAVLRLRENKKGISD